MLEKGSGSTVACSSPLLGEQPRHLPERLEDALLGLDVAARQPRGEHDLVRRVQLAHEVLPRHRRVGRVLEVGQVLEQRLAEPRQGVRVGVPEVGFP